jgi:hypothetical protein
MVVMEFLLMFRTYWEKFSPYLYAAMIIRDIYAREWGWGLVFLALYIMSIRRSIDITR